MLHKGVQNVKGSPFSYNQVLHSLWYSDPSHGTDKSKGRVGESKRCLRSCKKEESDDKVKALRQFARETIWPVVAFSTYFLSRIYYTIVGTLGISDSGTWVAWAFVAAEVSIIWRIRSYPESKVRTDTIAVPSFLQQIL